MGEKSFIERIEDVLDEMELRTFDASMTLDYRFGSFEAEIGVFRCFVNQHDVVQSPNYLEIVSDHIYWVALEYPGLDAFFQTVRQISESCFKTLGRLHTSHYILALEEGLLQDERKKILDAFQDFRQELPPGPYHSLKIWDEEGLRKEEKQVARHME